MIDLPIGKVNHFKQPSSVYLRPELLPLLSLLLCSLLLFLPEEERVAVEFCPLLVELCERTVVLLLLLLVELCCGVLTALLVRVGLCVRTVALRLVVELLLLAGLVLD